MSDETDADDVKETMTDDGQEVFYSTNPDDDNAGDTEEWIASDTTVSGSDPMTDRWRFACPAGLHVSLQVV